MRREGYTEDEISSTLITMFFKDTRQEFLDELCTFVDGEGRREMIWAIWMFLCSSDGDNNEDKDECL